MRFRFADYVLDTDRRELTRGAERVPVGPQVFDLLVHLVANRERVVSKDDMFEMVWSGRHRVRVDAHQPYQRRSQGYRRQR